jgi:hypothetical protein
MYKVNLMTGVEIQSFPVQYNFNDIAIDDDDNVYGSRSRNYNGLAKYSPVGSLVWEFRQNTSFAYGLAYYNEHLYLTEYNQYVRKIDLEGNEVWNDSRHNDAVNDVAVSSSGDVYSVSSDGSIRYRSEDSTYLGGRTLGGSVGNVLIGEDDYVYSVNTVPSNSSIPSEVKMLSSDLDQVLWNYQAPYGVRSIAVDSENNTYALMSESSPSRWYIAKLDSNGNEISVAQYGSSEVPRDIKIKHGFMYISTNSEIIKYDLNGNEIWRINSGYVYAMAVN